MAEAAQNEVKSITTLLCMIEDGVVIMPDASIAEIVDFHNTDAGDDMPTWYLGLLEWRNLMIPLVSLEGLNSDSFFTQSNRLKIIVVHSISYRQTMPYWSFVVAETPRMIKLGPDSLSKPDGVMLGRVEVMRGELSGEPVIIPDLVAVEAAIAQLNLQ